MGRAARFGLNPDSKNIADRGIGREFKVSDSIMSRFGQVLTSLLIVAPSLGYAQHPGKTISVCVYVDEEEPLEDPLQASLRGEAVERDRDALSGYAVRGIQYVCSQPPHRQHPSLPKG